MESSMSLSPVPSDLSQQNQESLSVSPSSSPRKRSIHDLEGPIESSPVHKRALIVPYDSENQENRDPAGSVTAKEATQTQKAASPWGAPPSVEILVGSGPTAAIPGSTGSLLVCTSSSGDMTSQRAGSGSPVKMDSSSARASKKRKLSPVSQDLKQQDKEARERQKQEEKAKREEDKRLRAEEKKKREEEREEERRLKEEDKKKREAEREEKRKAKDEERAAKEAAKEEERKRKEEEKLKKERAQPKLNSFFAKPSSPRPKVAPTEENSVTVQTPISIATESGEQHPTRPDLSDYQKAFPEFFLQSHTQIAPLHRFERDPQALEHVRQAIDATLNVTGTDSSFKPSFRPSEVFKYIPFRRRCGRSGPSVKDLLRRMQNAGDETLMDLDPQDQHKAAEEAHKALRQVPMKVLRFGEDVRPPYQGTFTRPMGEVAARKLARNPYHRGLPEVNYDYDSEAEWEEPEEEGEDLDSENDDEESDDGDDDMAEFLDDEDDALVGGKRRLIVGDLEPNCTGLCWAADGVTAEMKAYQIETISDAVRFPIDPFSTAYWEKPKLLDATTAHAPSKSTLDVFRVPNPTTTTPANAARSIMNGKVKKPFPPEQLPEFRTAVESSDLSKVGTIEILKKRFPKVAKDTLKATLEQYAVRVGQKETDKRWVWR
ncbi:hypothetical protein N7539_000351 [Penicillium diatomitis]|uniref:Chromatin assembly factor 1 subunit A n=1 Tax=Penicillium diatomitis TaxID=2819901 RepID=A0A9X0C2J8_9EURO|nr:uncharacterized protein N7539_000351 [Penicillium diatomitis]KAJ5495235.1 hypothetical protein N7539_000351 [Penicillium diatomitis]